METDTRLLITKTTYATKSKPCKRCGAILKGGNSRAQHNKMFHNKGRELIYRKGRKSVGLQIRIDKDVDSQLREYCAKNNTFISHVIEDALKEFLNAHSSLLRPALPGKDHSRKEGEDVHTSEAS